MSLRWTALRWLAALSLLIGAVSASVSYLLMRSEAANLLDSQLRQIAYYVGDRPSEPLHSAPGDPLYDPEDDFVVQIWEGAAKIYDTDPDIAVPRQGSDGFSNIKTAKNRWRTYTFVAPGRTVQISQDRVVRDELAAGAALRSAIPVAIIFPLSWVLLSFVINRVMGRLKPVIAVVEAQDLDTLKPVPIDDVPLEVRPLVRAMNGLVGRLQQSFERQRRFIADAAHELRTPLGALALQIGNLRRVARGKETQARLADLEAGMRRANALVAQLLRLARYDAHASAGATQPIRLADCLSAAIDEVEPIAVSKTIVIETAVEGDPSIVGVAEDLRVLIVNLIDNAVKYAPRGSCVHARLAMEDGRPCLTVSDEGPGIPEALRERVFERFVRATDSEVEGSGLGLAIVRSVAERHGLEVALLDRPDRPGLTVRLQARLPS
jgi:two-component system OmpR family sensor kinase/two-component system sensor histidine kinase QseC